MSPRHVTKILNIFQFLEVEFFLELKKKQLEGIHKRIEKKL